MRPLQIKQLSHSEVLIRWADGHESLYATEYLRLNCPCAACGEEREQNALSGTFSLPIAAKTALKDLQLSGRNAMVITWGDGHKTGIYTWDYLRGICPCQVCKG